MGKMADSTLFLFFPFTVAFFLGVFDVRVNEQENSRGDNRGQHKPYRVLRREYPERGKERGTNPQRDYDRHIGQRVIPPKSPSFHVLFRMKLGIPLDEREAEKKKHREAEQPERVWAIDCGSTGDDPQRIEGS